MCPHYSGHARSVAKRWGALRHTTFPHSPFQHLLLQQAHHQLLGLLGT